MEKYIKDLMFLIYAIVFDIGAKVGVKENRIGLVSMHNAHFADGLGEIERELKCREVKPKNEPEAGYAPFHQGEFKTIFEYGERVPYEFVKVERSDLFASKLKALKFLTLDAFRLGRSKYIFLNDNFVPLAFLHPAPETKFIQLWHGMGAFKKFGFDIDVPETIRQREAKGNKKLDFVVCSSKGVKPIYAKAFGVSEEKVLPLGCPTADYYFRSQESALAKERLFGLYPKLRDKYLILYAPTFRDDLQSDSDILRRFDAEALKRELYDKGIFKEGEVEILIRLHPQLHTANAKVKGATDVTDYDNVSELCLACDLLITDYSSICMDFVVQKKPTVYFAYDLSSYVGNRDFYFDYKSYVPGPVAKSSDELADAIKKAKRMRRKAFRDFNFDDPDGKASKRVVDYLLGENK